jgi:hypothetical protein
MSRGRGALLRALLLAAFLAAGPGVPALDVLLFHLHASSGEVGQAHVEPAGGCASHAGHCSLARIASGSAPTAVEGGTPSAEPAGRGLTPTPPPLAPPTLALLAAARPRAPPAHSA